MIGDKLVIKKHHTTAARKIAKVLTPSILKQSKYVITIAGESGAGKTEVAHELARFLKKEKIKSLTLHQDDYFKYPPHTNYRRRRKDISRVGTHEVKLKLLNEHIKEFKYPETKRIHKPLVHFDKNQIRSEKINIKDARVLIIDGTYTTLLKDADSRVLLCRSYKDTLKARLERKRDVLDKFDEEILEVEHNIISGHRGFADILIKKDYKSIVKRPKRKKQIKRMAMLTIHGYVDAKPTLGKIDTGGQVTYVLEKSKALAKMGITVDIYTRQFSGKKRVEKVASGVRIVRIPCGGNKFIPKEKLFPYLDAYVKNMERFMIKNKLHYDVYHSHYWDAGYVAMKISEKFNSFFIHTFHSLGAWKREYMGGNAKKMEKLYNFKKRIKIERNIFKKTRGLVMTSTDMIKHSKRFYNYTSNNYIVLPAGVNTDFFRPLKKGEKERKIDVPEKFIFWVGRFATNKGLDYLLKSFAEIVRKEKDLFLVIGGGSKKPDAHEKKLLKELHDIIKHKNLNHRVFFVHHIKDELMPTYYRKARFFVLPSKFEPFGMTGAEAMACGTALIVSKRAGIRKYLKNKYDCLMVQTSNKKDLGWAFSILNRNNTLRNKLAKNGLRTARAEFSWTKIAKKSLAYYYKLMN